MADLEANVQTLALSLAWGPFFAHSKHPF